MGKILQVIKKDSNFQNGKVKINLYETSFKTLSKLMDSVPGQTVQNAAAGQKVGYQVFRDLNSLQYAERLKLERFEGLYNSWINTAKSKVSSLLNFNYIFSSLTQDYSNTIVKDSKLDMLLLEKIVNPEKEIYDFIIKADDSIQNNLSKLREWSKSKVYGSNCKNFVSGLSVGDTSIGWGIKSTTGPCSWSLQRGIENNKSRVTATNLQALSVGQSSSVRVIGGSSRDYIVSITRLSLGNVSENDGYFTYSSVYPDGPNTGGFNLFNIPSPHFDTSNVNLQFLKSRVLI